jgi:hypothetical protein
VKGRIKIKDTELKMRPIDSLEQRYVNNNQFGKSVLLELAASQ